MNEPLKSILLIFALMFAGYIIGRRIEATIHDFKVLRGCIKQDKGKSSTLHNNSFYKPLNKKLGYPKPRRKDFIIYNKIIQEERHE